MSELAGFRGRIEFVFDFDNGKNHRFFFSDFTSHLGPVLCVCVCSSMQLYQCAALCNHHHNPDFLTILQDSIMLLIFSHNPHP